MLMWLFILFFALGLILTIAGFALDIPVLNLTGTIMIFLLGMGLLNDGLTYKVGETETYTYGNNFSSFNGTVPANASDEAYVFEKDIDAVYDHYNDADDNRFGWLLMAMGALGFVLSLFKL